MCINCVNGSNNLNSSHHHLHHLSNINNFSSIERYVNGQSRPCLNFDLQYFKQTLKSCPSVHQVRAKTCCPFVWQNEGPSVSNTFLMNLQPFVKSEPSVFNFIFPPARTSRNPSRVALNVRWKPSATGRENGFMH